MSKKCSCCGKEHDAASWKGLKYVGVMETEDETGKYTLELRNCSCGSTIGIETKHTQN